MIIYKNKRYLLPMVIGFSILMGSFNLDKTSFTSKSLNIESKDGENSINLGSFLLKDTYEKRDDRLILSYKHSLESDLRLNDIWILFNNEVLDQRYYHIFNNMLRVMLPSSMSDGTLRIRSIDSDGNPNRENHTILSSGIPISPLLNKDSPYFSNIYHIITDRFNDGDKENSQENDGTVDSKLRFHGGDFSGIKNKIDIGYFNRLNVGGILISPITQNPDNALRDIKFPYRKFMGFDGNQPVHPRDIDYRYGTSKDLKSLIEKSHMNGMAVYFDYIADYVHIDHPYYISNKDWFYTGSFAFGNYLFPKFDYSNTNVADKIISDIVYILDEYKFDGFLTDIHAYQSNFRQDMNNFQFNRPILRIVKSDSSSNLINNVTDDRNFDSSYNNKLYRLAREHFSGSNTDFIKLNNMIKEDFHQYKPSNLMITSTSLPNEVRFISVADGQSFFGQTSDNSIFLNPVEPILNPVSYEKLFMFMVMNYSLPGVPAVFYGEEIGQIGGYGPDSKRDMKFQEDLTPLEAHLKNRVSKLNFIRRNYPSLSIGDFMVLREGKKYSVWLKSYFDERILVLFNLQDKSIEINTALPFQAHKLISLLDEKKIKLDNPNMINLVLPANSSSIYILDID